MQLSAGAHSVGADLSWQMQSKGTPLAVGQMFIFSSTKVQVPVACAHVPCSAQVAKMSPRWPPP